MKNVSPGCRDIIVSILLEINFYFQLLCVHVLTFWGKKLRGTPAWPLSMLRPDKSRVIIIIINTQGQIVHFYFIWKHCLTRNHIAGCKFHLQRALCRLARKKERFREGSLSFSRV